MNEDIIGMEDMAAVYQVTDGFGIDREAISVPLEKADPGSVTRGPDGEIEITVPVAATNESWLDFLRNELLRLGLQIQASDEDSG